jgi:hypothetical protein
MVGGWGRVKTIQGERNRMGNKRHIKPDYFVIEVIGADVLAISVYEDETILEALEVAGYKGRAWRLLPCQCKRCVS